MYTQALIDEFKSGICQSLDVWKMSHDTQIELLTTSENVTFVAQDPHTGDKRVIRVHRPGYHERREIESEITWINALRTSGNIHTPRPISTTSENPVVSIHTDTREFHAVAFEYVRGHEPHVGQELPSWFAKLGAVTASLHKHSKAWQPPKGFMRKRWHLDTMIAPDGVWGDWREAPGISRVDKSVIHQAIEHIYTFIAEYGDRGDRYGLVHGDLRLANLLVSDERLTVIDFDDSGFCWYAYDFAAAISFHELNPMVPELRDAWIRGYRSIATFEEEDVAALDTFIMLRRIMLSAWLATHAESPTALELGKGYIQGTAHLARRYLHTRSCAMY